MTTETPPSVELRDVSKAFGDLRVLDQVSLAIPVGRGFCILGRSGTGKSVMLKHIIGLMKPDAGHVLIEGDDITGLSSRALSPIRQRIGFLFQNAALFDSISVGENVAFPLRRHTTLGDDEIRARATACSHRWVSRANTKRCPPTCPAACVSARDSRVRLRSSRRSCSRTSPAPVWIP
jgi:ABC-type transporter Mla maintaining outer membrane lipid asymmetry ATPase subunit MlaF